ncbi:unnamed protein product [Cylindrotheca closterium]|uniref:Uncharacterized protein n=1 Tax=Cylindrotheca closterium TaxID=2856 RepID=A0AAD2FLG6_9STRA|nr:unnamed protein product [Cylindrotheca closterium]
MMPKTQQHLLLEQAFIAVPYLDEIHRLSRILEMQTGMAIIFDDYVTLVESAAQSFDTRQVSKPRPKNNPSRDVYSTGVDTTLPPEVVDNARDNILGYVTERQSLRPGGANGGIAGDDVITLSQTNCAVEVGAIDDHQLTDVSIKTLPHIILTSDKNWDPGVLDSRVDEFDPKPDNGLEDLDPKVDDFDKWTDCITGDGLEGAKSRFDQVDILKRNSIFDEAIFDEAIHFFETFQYASPFDEPYKDSECTDTGTDCPDTGPDYFDRNMVESSCPDPYYIDPPIFVILEASKSCRHPSVLLVPDASIKFDVEVGPLFTKESSQELTHDLPTRPPTPKDTFTIDIPSKPRCYTSRKDCFGCGIWPGNGERQYFAWLPKLSFHCTTTDLARPPTNAHHEHKYHPLSPLPKPISCMVVLVGIAKHDCHNMTNIFLFLKTNNVLLPSAICSALPPTGLHKRLVLPDGEELALPTITKSIDLSDGEELTPPTKIKSRDHKSLKTIVHSSDVESDIEDVLLEEKDLIGRTFLLSPDDEGYVQCAKIVELNYKRNRNAGIQPARIQLCLNIDKGKYEHVMAYHEIHKWSETDKDNPIDTKLKQVVCHHHYI